MTLSLSRRRPMGLLAIMTLVSCASPVAADTESVQSGSWDDPATWGGALPGLGEEVTISAGHVVHFPPSQDYTVELDRNLIVHGELEMRPQQVGNPYYQHTLRFVGVDETAFQMGGLFPCGTQPPASDVGVWVLCDGVLDLEGEPKRGWARTTADALAGAQSMTLDQTPIGWRPGDTIVIAPSEDTSAPDPRGYRGFEELTIEQVGGNTVYFSPALGHDHPCAVGFRGTYCPEVANLSRNVVIEGQGDHDFAPQTPGRAHVFIQSTQPQSIQYATLRLLGPRTTADNQRNGRYPLHFHHSGDGSRGSIVRGTVAMLSGSYAYVPHESHGITFEDAVAYDVFESAFWWDEDDVSNDIAWHRSFAGRIDSLDGRRLAGFLLGLSTGSSVVDSVGVGVDGGIQSAGFVWDEDAGSTQPWPFERNVGHNNKGNGIMIWQNCPFAEDTGKCGGVNVVGGEIAMFHNGWGSGGHKGSGIEFGAYTNAYSFHDLDLFGNQHNSMELHARARPTDEARPDGYLNVIEDFDAEGLFTIVKHRTTFDTPQLIIDGTLGGVRIYENGGELGLYDFVRTNVEPEDFTIEEMRPDSVVRVQRADCTAFQYGPNAAFSTISAFYECGDPPPPDTEAPTVPANLVATAVSSSQIDLAWDASTDDNGVDHYKVYRDGAFHAEVVDTGFSDTNLLSETTYVYEVSAVDAAANESDRSAPADATTLAEETDAGDDGSTDDGSTDDGSTDDGSTDDGSTDDGSTDDGSTDDGSTDDGSTDDGSTDDGSTDDGSTDDGSTGDGSTGGDALFTWNGPEEFDGVDDFVDISPLDVPGEALTIVARVNADSWADDARIVSKATSASSASRHWWMLSERNNGLRFRLKTNGSTSTLEAARGMLQTGVWYHFAAVYDGSAMRLYLDGVEVGSMPKSGPIDTDSNVDVWIGGSPDGSNWFDGVIEDVRIYGRALSATEVADLAAQ